MNRNWRTKHERDLLETGRDYRRPAMDGAEVAEMTKTLGLLIAVFVVLFVAVPISREFKGRD